MRIKIYVYGWYGKNNLGDEAFKDSFRYLWPQVDFTFASVISPNYINAEYQYLWIGGGSFLEQTIPDLDKVTIPIAFIGVGGCSCPAEATKAALERAEVIVFRNESALTHWNTPQAHAVADLVFAREFQSLNLPKKDQITVFLNDFITPKAKGAEWKSLAYNWFLQEFSKILDRFSTKYTIKLFPMCINPRVDDRRVGAAVLGRSEYPHRYDWMLNTPSEHDLRVAISESKFVITQRFHGLVYSILEDTPCVTMTMHDKFASLCRELEIPMLDFYGMTDKRFKEVLGAVRDKKFVTPKIQQYMDEKRNKWLEVSQMISEQLEI